jgi:hypothetical protein|tara:strand:+ start:7160 stop:8011 length:852 start_codon:yes stop_codon:yes gene_type:complete
MKFSLFTENGAQNSKPVFDAFATSLHSAGHTVTVNDWDCDVAVIWSVLWFGRMAGNQKVWEHFRAINKPVIVLEVGGIQRGTTWKVGINGINSDANFGAKGNDSTRADLLGLEAKRWTNDGQHILVCGQHDKSLQWQGMPRMSNWFLNTYDEIRKHTDRPIVFRPHPRCRLDHIERGLRHVYRQEPNHINDTYDDFDLDFNNVWATVSYSSNPGIHSILNGVPAFVGTSSLAYDVGNDIDFFHDIEAPLQPDRRLWLNDYAYTEWTLDEIAQGLPLKRLTSEL